MQLIEYALVFIAAAIPWMEIALVIPVGIVRGLSPFWVMLLAFTGNMVTVLLLIAAFSKVEVWLEKRLERTGLKGTKQADRARQIMNRYGFPTLALLGPLFIGTHIAVFIGLSFGASRGWTTLWITVSIALWTLIIGIATVLGFDFFLQQTKG
ncbi:small multi-drug export protein [Domibacillus sp. DTU_2020_1001157_1_SI_ALB_TIR_016]|uniref:small multi-drug export protein n=1 Tax=Domibacillus sp. DTU_2020_1001157_1_SI_ALB_TIR_016 TaxID=3077789 RepID=UPI0028EB8805|nr:small multi-drug export protein [Domibacillus sp. DTU_2020_1001157_1_SI_ALB_TIR_016]WNS81450.1 small multi-drug export protein [Domibacillus sp. DTU_2020_1001157_1_SI_ALB_TIR_016]